MFNNISFLSLVFLAAGSTVLILALKTYAVIRDKISTRKPRKDNIANSTISNQKGE